MAEPDSILLTYMRRFDEKIDRVISALGDLKIHVTALEQAVANTHSRIDRVEIRLDRIERRLELVDAT